MKFVISVLIALGIGLPFGGCTGVFVAAVAGGGLWTVGLVATAFIVSGYVLSNNLFDREEAKAVREQMETELLAAQWEELQTRKR